MVDENVKPDKQLIENSYKPRIETSRKLHNQKQAHSSKNPQTTIKFTPSSTAASKSFTVVHQNIRGLRGKSNEFIGSVLLKLPYVICLTEHHLKELEIENLSIDHYTLGAKFCRQTLKQGGSSIFVHNSLDFNTIELH